MVAVLILSPLRIDARRLDRFKELDAFVKKPLGAPYDSSERRQACERAGRKDEQRELEKLVEDASQNPIFRFDWRSLESTPHSRAL